MRLQNNYFCATNVQWHMPMGISTKKTENQNIICNFVLSSFAVCMKGGSSDLKRHVAALLMIYVATVSKSSRSNDSMACTPLLPIN